MKIHGFIGSGYFSTDDGPQAPLVLDRTGAVIRAQAHGRYTTGSYHNGTFTASTAVTGVVPGATTLTTAAAFWLHNPLNSGVTLSLNKVSMGFKSGTFGAGTVYLTTAMGAPQAIPTGTAIISHGALCGGNATPSATAFTTATVPTQIALKPLWRLFAGAAGTALPFSSSVIELAGMFAIPPGFGVGITSISAAGTSPLVIYGMTWEEISIGLSTDVGPRIG